MNWTETLVFKLMNQHVFEGIQPSQPDSVIATYLKEKEEELRYHPFEDVVAAVNKWKRADK